MLPELAPEEVSEALDGVAAEVLASLPAVEPPIDALQLARGLGLNVAWDERQSGRGRIARLAGGGRGQPAGSILLRPDPRRERLQWAIAHEVGEWCAHRVFERLAVDPRVAPGGAREAVANRLAARLLLPPDAFERDARTADWHLPALKVRYETASHELIARRMLDFEPAVMITVFDQGRRTFRRGNLTFRLPPLAEVERAAWRVAHEQSRSEVSADFVRRVQAWPVHEPAWKREILRTEWLEGEAS